MKLIALMSATAVAVAALAPVPALADRHGWKSKTVCKTSWHHGHKIRECHKVRVRW